MTIWKNYKQFSTSGTLVSWEESLGPDHEKTFRKSKGVCSEKAMAPHSSTLAWKIPWMEEPGGLQSMGSRQVGHNWATSLSLFTFTFHFHALEKEMATHSSVLAWRIPGTGEPVGLPSMGSHRVGHDWSDLAAVAAAVYLKSDQIRTIRGREEGKPERKTEQVINMG